MREVSDSLHLRRFCRLGLSERVPDESTARKLTRRLGPEIVDEITRVVIGKAQREARFRPRAVRVDSTVVEADVRYLSDAMLALQGARALAREGRKLAGRLGGQTTRVVDRSRSISKTVRAISRTLARRLGRRVEEVIELNAEAGRAMARSLREARRLAAQTRSSARGRGAQAKLRGARALEELVERCERVTRQIEQRSRGERITDRLVSLSDPDARPIRKGKLGKPNEFGYVAQSPRSPPTLAAAHAAMCCPPRPHPATPQRTRSCPTPSQSSSDLRRGRERSPSTAVSATAGRPSSSLRSALPASMSPPAENRARAEREDGWRATAPEPRGASATSNAGMASPAADSKDTEASGFGPAG